MHMGMPKTVAMPAASACCMIVSGMIIMRIMGVVMIVLFRAARMRMGVCICCVIMPCGAGFFCMAMPVCLARHVVLMITGRTRRLGRWRMIVRRRHGKAHSCMNGTRIAGVGAS